MPLLAEFLRQGAKGLLQSMCGEAQQMAYRIFLSYKRADHTTPAVERLKERLEVQLDEDGTSSNVKVFFDRNAIEAGGEWATEIDDFLADATHFIALISVPYWRSEQCKREFDLALARYELSQPPRVPRMLFILADKSAPSDFAVKPLDVLTRQSEEEAEGASRVQRIKSLGQFNFLGPYDQAGRLVRLAFEEPFKLDDQFAEMVATIKKQSKG